jgi:hypothetical protein
MISAMLLKKRRPEAYKNAPFKLRGPIYWIAPSFGLLLAIMTIAMLLFDSINKRGPAELVFFVIWLIVGWLLYRLLATRMERSTGKTVKEVIAGDEFL